MKPMKKSELRALIREQVKTILKEAVSQEAHIIHTITQCGQDAAQNFIDDNKLDGKKLAAYVKQHSNAKEKYDVRDLIANTGKGAIKGFRERFLKLFKESVIKENEHLDLSTWKIGDNVEFSNGEIWKVAKPGYKKANDSIFLAPFNAIAKKGHISLPIEFTADELTNTVTESITEAASDISYINKARAKSSLDQIKKGKRADGMGKFDAKVYAIKGTQEIELKTPEDLAKYSVGYKYGLKNESINEGDMTRQYDGFIVLDSKTKKSYKFKYIKGVSNVNVENNAIDKVAKATHQTRANFMVHGFVKKGQWDSDKSEIFKESVLKEFGPMAGSGNVRANDLDNLKRDAAKKSERGDTVYIVGGKNGTYKLSKYFEKGNTYAAFYNGMPQIVEGITEASITEAKEYSFTFDYNTDPDDIEYIENLLKKARVNAYAEQGTFDDEMVVIAGDAIELRKAKKAIEADGFQINESINEDAGMVVDVAMGVAVGLMGLWALVQSAPLVGRVFGDAAEYLANKSEKKAKSALKNQRKETIAPIIAKFKNDTELKQMYQNLTPYSQGLNRKEVLDNKVRQKQLITIGKYIKSKLTADEMQYFTDVSAMLRDGDIK